MDNFVNYEASEEHIGINRFKSVTAKARDLMTKVLPFKYLNKLKTPTNYHTKASLLIESIVEVNISPIIRSSQVLIKRA